MRVTPEEYNRIDLRAHALLAGVPLEDVWAVDLAGRRHRCTIDDVRGFFSLEQLRATNAVVNLLVTFRMWLGRVFDWDRTPARIHEESYLHRLSPADRAASLVPPGTADGPFRVLFVSPREAIAELHNSTVHGFSVLALVERPSGYRLYWGIHVLPVGRLTRFYMRLIDPFRRIIIYPAVLRHVRAAWARGEGAAEPPER